MATTLISVFFALTGALGGVFISQRYTAREARRTRTDAWRTAQRQVFTDLLVAGRNKVRLYEFLVFAVHKMTGKSKDLAEFADTDSGKELGRINADFERALMQASLLAGDRPSTSARGTSVPGAVPVDERGVVGPPHGLPGGVAGQTQQRARGALHLPRDVVWQAHRAVQRQVGGQPADAAQQVTGGGLDGATDLLVLDGVTSADRPDTIDQRRAGQPDGVGEIGVRPHLVQPRTTSGDVHRIGPQLVRVGQLGRRGAQQGDVDVSVERFQIAHPHPPAAGRRSRAEPWGRKNPAPRAGQLIPGR